MDSRNKYDLETEIAVVDWGTSSFRLWALKLGGSVRSQITRSCGMSLLKPDQFQDVLETALTEINLPRTALTVVCGMAGAAQGWIEAPYLPLPSLAEKLAARTIVSLT